MNINLQRRDIRFTLIYSISTILWLICLHTLINPFPDGKPIELAILGVVTGAGFVTFTSLALFLLLRCETQKHRALEQHLSESPEKKYLETVVRDSEARYQLMIEVASEGIQFIGPDARITYINPQMSVLHGFQSEEVIGHEYFEYIHPDAVESARQRFQQRKQGVRGARDVQIRHKNGHYIWVHVSSAPVFGSDGTFQGTLTMYTDITEAKTYEQSLEKALQRETELSDLKTRLVTMASHEFRTPLAIILSSSELLLQYRDRMNDQKVDEKLNSIRDQVAQLTSIIKEVLDVGQMQSKYLELKPELSDLDALCQEVVDEFQKQSNPTPKLHYTHTPLPFVIKLDNRLMRQAITNLISNAIKYSPSGSDIFVRMEPSANTAVLSIRDQGIGIPEADIPYLFENFHRGTNVGTISGVGLGLAITKQIVELHGGTLTLESKLGVGTTFFISIPAVISVPEHNASE